MYVLYKPDLCQMGLSQAGLDQDVPGLSPRQEPTPGPILCVEHLGELQLGVVRYTPVSIYGRGTRPKNKKTQAGRTEVLALSQRASRAPLQDELNEQ